MSAHALIAPSSMALTVACSASVQLQNKVPPMPQTEEEAEGHAWHWLALQFARGRDPAFPLGAKFEHGGHTWEVDAEMHSGAALWARQWPRSAYLETPVNCSAIHEEHCSGTPDGFEFVPFGTGPMNKPLLRIGDFKGGFRHVEVFENPQLLSYYVGALEFFGLSDADLIVEFFIVQPRSYTHEGPVRTWRIPAIDLRALVNIMNSAAHAALAPKPVATTGRHCLDCKARHACRTLQYTTANLVDFSGTGELSPLDPSSMGQELRIVEEAIKRLEARRSGMAPQVEALLRAGELVPHYELGPGQSRRQWLAQYGAEDIAAVGDMLGVGLRKTLAVLTPTQAIAAGIDESVISLYAERAKPSLKLQRTSNIAARKALGAAGVTRT